MRYLITGGTGLIGSHFCLSLNADDQVTVLSRTKKPTSSPLKRSKCSIRFVSSLEALSNLNDIDCVINLAGEPIADKRWTKQHKTTLEQSRWETTQVLNTLFKTSSTPPHTFISGSAIGFYGRQDTKPMVESSTEIYDEFTHRLCSKWESIALDVQRPATRVCVLRTGIVLAKGQGALAKMTLPFQLGLGGKIGSGEQGMSWIHIDDMIAGIHHLIQNKNLNGAFNFTAPFPVSNKDFVNELGHALSRPTFIPMPAFALSTLMGESADLLLTGQFVYPEKLLLSEFKFSYPKLNQALGNLFH